MDIHDYQKKFWEDQKRGARRSPDHSVVRAFAASRIKFVQQYIKISQYDTKLLDVGCGNGYFTIAWAEICDTTGLDYSKKMLENNPHRQLVRGDVNNLPFADNSFDIVFCSNLLHHLDDVGKALIEMKRVAKRYVIISEPNRNNPLLFLFACFKKEERGIRPFTKNFLSVIGQKNGLKVIAVQTAGLIFPNKTPKFMLPLLKWWERPMLMGVTIEIIFEK